jgi:oligopeptide/dipeptide ABC transporter ATP-binding protein
MSASVIPSTSRPPRRSKSDVLLRVEGLKTYFISRNRQLKAVDGVSFTVRRGEAVGIVGESGSGKSVTCLSIMGLTPTPGCEVVAGSVWFDGEDLVKLPERQLRSFRGRRIAMIMQDPQTSLNPVFNIGDQVAEPVRLHLHQRGQKALDRVLEALRAVRIPTPELRLGQYPHQFSGGMRQRVVAAMGLTTYPELLVADEPTTSLDVTIQAQFLRLIRDLQQDSGTSVVWVTHDLGIVAQMCERVNVMYAGRIVESSQVRKLYKSPQHPYTRALLDSVPIMGTKRERLYQIEGQPPDLRSIPSGCPFWPRCPVAMDICKEEYPPRTSLGGDDYVHCWLAER